MARLLRSEIRSNLLHVYHRGIAHRRVFANAEQMWLFLRLLRRQVKLGRWRIHGFSLLSNHFHLHVEGDVADVSAAMHAVLSTYTREFNAQEDRDGPLFRGRFSSRAVQHPVYRWNLQRYLDLNPVQAKLVDDPLVYPFGSARLIVGDASGGLVCTAWADELMDACREPGETRAQAYRRAFRLAGGDECLQAWGVRFQRRGVDGETCRLLFDDGAIPAVSDWLRSRAQIADGRVLRESVLPAEYLLAELPRQAPESQGRRLCSVATAESGLLRDLCAYTVEELVAHTGYSRFRVRRRLRMHSERMIVDAGYLAEVSAWSVAALATFRSHAEGLVT